MFLLKKKKNTNKLSDLEEKDHRVVYCLFSLNLNVVLFLNSSITAPGPRHSTSSYFK